jgi:hypothetical protein
MARFLLPLLSTLLLLFTSVHAQFQFFEQMFNGQQQQRQPQDVPSDSQWYQENYDRGTELPFIFSDFLSSIINIKLINPQPIAPTTSVPTRSPVSLSHTTVPAHTQPMKRNSNWQREMRFVCLKGVSKLERRRGRLSWRERG